jgi:hypothetical protein
VQSGLQSAVETNLERSAPVVKNPLGNQVQLAQRPPTEPTSATASLQRPPAQQLKKEVLVWCKFNNIQVLQTEEDYKNAINTGRPAVMLFSSSWDRLGGLPWYVDKFAALFDQDVATNAVRCIVDIDAPGTSDLCTRHEVTGASMPSLIYFENGEKVDRMEGAQISMLTLFQGVDRAKYDRWLSGMSNKN